MRLIYLDGVPWAGYGLRAMAPGPRLGRVIYVCDELGPLFRTPLARVLGAKL